MEKILLSEIAAVLGTECPLQAEINEICIDTRTITAGCLFIAVKGNNFDGHDFAEKAMQCGAVAVVTERQIEKCPCIVTKNTRKAFLDIAHYYRMKFSPLLIGVTGSVGKTTTKEMIALVLSEKYKTLKTHGNFNNEIGLPKTLLKLDSSIQAAVIEMGMSDFGEIEKLSKTAHPNIGVITNIGFSHIENLKSQEGILKAKLEILAGMDDGAPLIVNGDDKLLRPLKESISSRKVYTYGLDEKCDFRGVNILESNDITEFDVQYNDKKIKVKLPCIGKHNVQNALAAFCIGIKSGLTDEECVLALKKYSADSMRQNIVKKGDQTIIIDCYNASPDSMKASLTVLQELKCEGRRIAVLGDMLELGEASEKLHTMVGSFVGEVKPDKLFCYGSDSKNIYAKAESMGVASSFTADKAELTSLIKEYLKPGDTVLFKGSRGMRLEEVIDNLYKD